MLSSILKDRVAIRVRTATITSLGETVTWEPVSERYARVIPLDARTRLLYQQNKSEVTDRILFNKGEVSLTLGDNRITHGSKTYEPVEPQLTVDKFIVVKVKEI